MTAHVIFDVNMDAGFTHKARFVADGHKVDMPTLMIYVSIVSRGSAQIVLMLAALNGFDMKCANVQNC